MILKRIKTLVFSLIGLFASSSYAFATGLKTDDLKKQDDAIAGAAGLAGNSNLANVISILISVILGFLGIVFLVLTIMAGFKWMMSQGNEDEIKKAKGSLKNSIIGLVIVLAAYAITYSIFRYLPFSSNATGGGGGTGL